MPSRLRSPSSLASSREGSVPSSYQPSMFGSTRSATQLRTESRSMRSSSPSRWSSPSASWGSSLGRDAVGEAIPARYLATVNAAEAVGRTLAALGVRDAFGVLGSGNFIASQALHAAGAAFHHARHENGAICMADGYARVSGRVGVCSVHQGPGFTNAMTGLTEAAK